MVRAIPRGASFYFVPCKVEWSLHKKGTLYRYNIVEKERDNLCSSSRLLRFSTLSKYCESVYLCRVFAESWEVLTRQDVIASLRRYRKRCKSTKRKNVIKIQRWVNIFQVSNAQILDSRQIISTQFYIGIVIW